MGSSPRWSWRAAVLASLVLLPTAVLAGCEPRVSLGRSCELSSECDPPYVCAAGRCRVECHEVRDCPFPLECLVVGNASGCRVPQDGMCPRGTIDCAEGLECIEGKCTQPCTDHSECASAQTCDEAGGCERPVVPEGSCDALSGAGCTADQRCSTAGVCESTGVTISAVQSTLFGACDATHPCRDGLDCRAGRCVRLCRVDADGQVLTSCGTDSRCRTVDEGGPAPTGFGWCTQPCDPADAGSCAPGLGCGVDFLGDNVTLTSCEAVVEPDCASDPSLEGCMYQPCTGSARCVAGTDCLDTLSVGPTPALCLPYCDESGACPADSTCVRGRFSVHYHIGNDAFERGICVPSCTVGEGICPTPDELQISCDETHPIEGTTALCTQACESNTDCFEALFVCDLATHLCTRNPS